MNDFDALLSHACDRARWTEARAMLLDRTCRVFGSRNEEGWIIVSNDAPLAAVIGCPARQTFDHATTAMPPDVELLVVPDDLRHARQMLPHWRVVPAVLHELPASQLPHGEIARPRDVVVIDGVDASTLEGFPPELHEEVRRASIIAVTRVDAQFVAACCTKAITETR